MATIKTELYRDNEDHSWVTVEVSDSKEMSLTFSNESGGIITISRLSKKEAEQLGDIIRNASIDYMEDSEA